MDRVLAAIMVMFSLFAISSCKSEKSKEITPWGTVVGEDSISSDQRSTGLGEVYNTGELIMLTLSGPESYFDYHGKGMGIQYLLCKQFTQSIGVSLRVEVCKDTAEMISRLQEGEGDVIAYKLPRSLRGVSFAGPKFDDGKYEWAVRDGNNELKSALDSWFQPKMLAEVKKQEDYYLSAKSTVKHVYSPYLNRNQGIISRYDSYFQQYAPIARWDWRLMAAQCYQESTFDPNARSWAGARGLMQIMPGTAAHLGLSMDKIHDPASNIEAAARLIKELNGHFSDIPGRERIAFVLASYNGGQFHIRDAMALAKKNGKDPKRWENVQEYVLKLSDPTYYKDPIVRYGYMRGSETVDYVSRILDRWGQYSHGVRGFTLSPQTTPQRSKKGNRWQI